MKENKFGIAISVFVAVVVIGILFSRCSSASKIKDEIGENPTEVTELPGSTSVVVTGAVGGGKENFLADEDVKRILAEKYDIVLDPHHWSNGKLITQALTYEDGGETKNYDFAFFSDERFYEYYKQPAAPGEAPRLPQMGGAVTLSTPIVFYSWKEVATVLEEHQVVEKRGEVYYITDMGKLLDYIGQGESWANLGLPDTFGTVNIASTDPVTSSPGATYYGLLASIMRGGHVDITNVHEALPQLNKFYKFSGFLNNTPADLFDLYLRMGRGAYPIIVDYEKSMLDFANSNPEGFQQVKDKIAILYSQPTIWNSHCIIAFSPEGRLFMEAMKDKEIQAIAWERYGFRTGVVGGDYDVTTIAVPGIPQEILSVVPSLRKEVYDIMIESLKTGEVPEETETENPEEELS